MAEIDVSATPEGKGRRSLRGQWWLPDVPEKRVGGTLEFVPGEGGRLELHGGLMGEQARPWPIVVFGLADGTDVTLVDAHYRGHTGQSRGPEL